MGEVLFADFISKRLLPRDEVIAQTAHMTYKIAMGSGRMSQERIDEMQAALQERRLGLTRSERKEVDRLAREKISDRSIRLGRKAMEDMR